MIVILFTLLSKVGLGVILGLRREVYENCALLAYYAAGSGNLLPTFRDKPVGTIFKGHESSQLLRFLGHTQ